MNIDDFMAQYEREYDFYQQAAHLCQQHCEILLAQKGIKAIVTSRAKKYDRLQQKIKQRASEHTYNCFDDIYNDIMDLAGVRIALYFPGNDKEIDKLMHAEFPYEKRFSGYKARHYNIYLKNENLTDQRYAKICIEIQVASVLMHGWAEVEHDLLYKPLSGNLSEDEHAILDEINGLVLAGEIALERLQKAQERRVGKKGNRFKDQYELVIFLSNHLRTQDAPIIMGRADLLFLLLQLAKLDRPEKLIKFTSDLDITDKQKTITDQLIDSILASDPELNKLYETALIQTNIYPLNDNLSNALEFFFTAWNAFDQFIDIKLEYLGTNKPSPYVQRLLIVFEDDKTLLREFEPVLRLRNDIVHKGKLPEVGDLFRMALTIRKILIHFISTSPEDLRKKIEASEEITKFLGKAEQ